MLEKDLENLGLSEKEAKVYIASLQLGKSSVQNISKKAGVNRATTYVIIDELSKKGLISSIYEGKKQYFFAEAPEKLNLLFRDQELEIKRKQKYLQEIIPNLKAINTNKGGKPMIRFFEGKEGVRAIAEELYTGKNKETVRAFYSYDLLTQMFPKEEIDNLRQRRVAKGIKTNVITNDDQNRLKTDAEVIRIKSKDNPITSDIAIIGDKTRIIIQKGEFAGLVIENKEISNTLKTLFDLAWKGLKNKKGPEK